MNVTDLIAAIATSIRQFGGAPTKTKILKLLYLLDIEAYRKSQTTLTGFEWVFYLYGPWAPTYDEALQGGVETHKIRVEEHDADEGATFINPAAPVALSVIFPKITEELTAKRIIEAWAARPTVELLDYVYFHTAPMRDAIRNQPLDFTTVTQEERPSYYTGIKSQLGEKEKREKRKELLRRLGAVTKSPIRPLDPPPQYDDSYWSALAKLESDPD